MEIPEALCAEIREFARALPEMSYHEVLGVELDADVEAVRRAFFERTKRFHPDRYFNKKLGAYDGLLHEIYKRVVAANEVLRDPQLRQEYEKALRERQARAPAGSGGTARPCPPSAESPEPAAAARPQEPPKRRSLRERKGLRSRDTVFLDLQSRLQKSRTKARAHFDQARAERERGDWARAARFVRLCLAFDPREQLYHDALADIMPRANAEQADQARRRADVLLARGEASSALEFLERAFGLVPSDPKLAHLIAEILAKDGGDLERAAEYASQAVQLDEKNAQYRKTLGMIYRAAGSQTKARKELQRAWELDPLDKEVKAALSVL